MDTSKPLSTRKNKNDLDIVTVELKKGFEWTTKHTSLVIGLVAAFVILGGGFAVYKMMSKKNEMDLQAKYYDLEAVVNKKRADFEQAKNPMPPQPGEPAPAVTAKPTGDIAKDFGDVTTGLMDFAKANPNSAAGSMAALNLASIQAEYNQPEAAIETLKSVNVQKSFLGSLVQMELATQLANSGKCPDAHAIWEKLAAQDSASFLKAEAKLKMGLCAESTGDFAKAQGFYKEVELENKESAAGRSAAQYLRLFVREDRSAEKQLRSNLKSIGLVSVVLALGLSACAQLEKLSENSPRRTFQVSVDWVKRGPAVLNMNFRKINRFQPVFFQHPKAGPVVIQGNAIDGVVAYRRDNGQEVWRRAIPQGVEAGAALQGEFLFFGGCDGMFYSISAIDGSIAWSFPTRIENIADPIYQDGLVYFLTGANTLYALEADSGKQAWLYSRQDSQALSIRGGSKPVFQNGTLFAGFSDGAVVALNAKTGALKWEKVLNRNKRFRDLDSALVAENEFLYLAGFDDAFYALRSATGEIAWKFDQGGYGAITIAGDRIFYASSESELVALNKATGQKVWGVPLKTGLPTAPVLSRGLLAFGESHGGVRWVDAGTGKPVASFATGSGVMAQPTVDEKAGRLFLISTEGNVYSMNAAWKLGSSIPYLR